MDSSKADCDKKKCLICNKVTKLVYMRTHAAKHYLEIKTVRNFCGFCGIACGSKLGLKASSGAGINTTYKPYSDCKYKYEFVKVFRGFRIK